MAMSGFIFVDIMEKVNILNSLSDEELQQI